MLEAGSWRQDVLEAGRAGGRTCWRQEVLEAESAGGRKLPKINLTKICFRGKFLQHLKELIKLSKSILF